MKKILILSAFLLILVSCKTIGKKVDTASKKEEERLTKFLKKTESELQIEFGKPDKVELSENQNTIFIYYDSKLKIKCERRFEINKKSKVVGYSSKNCF
tara:strand:- start:138 stop:434 length:297 start_codon:yes stop_codon:yes gene_type:complete